MCCVHRRGVDLWLTVSSNVLPSPHPTTSPGSLDSADSVHDARWMVASTAESLLHLQSASTHEDFKSNGQTDTRAVPMHRAVFAASLPRLPAELIGRSPVVCRHISAHIVAVRENRVTPLGVHLLLLLFWCMPWLIRLLVRRRRPVCCAHSHCRRF